MKLEKMNKYTTLLVNGYWLDSKETFNDMMVALESWDGVEDEEDEHIFYYLDGKSVLGEHDEFCITEIN